MQLTPDQKDTLTELINIGFSRTAVALSELTGHRVLLDVPEVSFHPIQELAQTLAKFVPQQIASVHQVFHGPVAGDALLLLNCEGAALLTDLLTNQSPRADSRLDESAREVLAETGNILLNACLGMFGNLLKVQVSFSVPRVELDVLESMMRTLVVSAQELRYALVVATRFRLRESTVEGCLVIVLGVSAMDRLLQAIDQLEATSRGQIPPLPRQP